MKRSIIAVAVCCFSIATVATCTVEPTDPPPPIITAPEPPAPIAMEITEEVDRQAFLEGLRCMASEDASETSCISACGKYQDSATFAACLKAVEFSADYDECEGVCVD